MSMLVLTVIGQDRAGLVDALSEVIDGHGANWEQSHMGRLAGRFAGIVLVQVPDAAAAALTRDLEALRDRGLHVRVEAGHGEAREPTRRLKLELVGQDHPGIVHDIAHALAASGISIDSLDTRTLSASMSGEAMFQASAELSAPMSVDLDTLSRTLEALANELMVDLDIDEAGGA